MGKATKGGYGRAASSEKRIAATSGALELLHEPDGLLSRKAVVRAGHAICGPWRLGLGLDFGNLLVLVLLHPLLRLLLEAFCAGTGRAGWLRLHLRLLSLLSALFSAICSSGCHSQGRVTMGVALPWPLYRTHCMLG